MIKFTTLFSGIVAQIGDRSFLSLQRILEIPIFIYYWGLATWGEWLLLISIVEYLSLCNLGFSNAATNSASIYIGKAKTHRAGLTLSTLNTITLFVGISVATISILLNTVFQINEALNLNELLEYDLEFVINILILSGFFNVLSSVPFSGLVSCNYLSLATFVHIAQRLFYIFIIIFGIPNGLKPDDLAILIFVINSVSLTILWILFYKFFPETPKNIVKFNFKIFKFLLKNSLSLFRFEIGTLIHIQGIRVLIGTYLGPISLSTYYLIRTISQIIVQVTSVINLSIRPKLSQLYGKRNYEYFNYLTKINIYVSASLAIVFLCAILMFGTNISEILSNRNVSLSNLFLIIITTSSLAEVIWRSLMTPIISINKHQYISWIYLLFYGLANTILIYIFKDGITLEKILIIILSVNIFLTFINYSSLDHFFRATLDYNLDLSRLPKYPILKELLLSK